MKRKQKKDLTEVYAQLKKLGNTILIASKLKKQQDKIEKDAKTKVKELLTKIPYKQVSKTRESTLDNLKFSLTTSTRVEPKEDAVKLFKGMVDIKVAKAFIKTVEVLDIDSIDNAIAKGFITEAQKEELIDSKESQRLSIKEDEEKN